MTAAIERAAAALPSGLRNRVWQGDRRAHDDERTLASGHPSLDALLPGHGWPLGGLTELLVERGGIGEMRLLAPVLKTLTQAGQHVLLVAPPWQPYAPALAAWGLALERVVWVRADADGAPWAAEQALRQDGVGAVLLWLAQTRVDAVRRLQVAALDRPALGFVFRPPAARRLSSPAPLRLACAPVAVPLEDGRRRQLRQAALSVDIFKRRGPPLAQPLNLILPLQHAVLPEAAAPAPQPASGVRHVVDRGHVAAVAAGSGAPAGAAVRAVEPV